LLHTWQVQLNQLVQGFGVAAVPTLKQNYSIGMGGVRAHTIDVK